MRRSPAVLIALVAALMTVAACDTGDGRTMRPPTSDERANVPTSTTTTTAPPPLPADVGVGAGSSTTIAAAVTPFALTVPWGAGGVIDVTATCDGANLSPLLSWTAPPAGTVELALVVSDDDAADYVHWAVIGIPPTAGEKSQGVPFTGAVEGVNDAGTVGWSGPCPPAGAPHTYRFALYALSQQAELPDGFSGAELRATAASAAVGLAEATGTYTRAA